MNLSDHRTSVKNMDEGNCSTPKAERTNSVLVAQHRAALLIQQAYRHYSLGKNFAKLRQELATGSIDETELSYTPGSIPDGSGRKVGFQPDIMRTKCSTPPDGFGRDAGHLRRSRRFTEAARLKLRAQSLEVPSMNDGAYYVQAVKFKEHEKREVMSTNAHGECGETTTQENDNPWERSTANHLNNLSGNSAAYSETEIGSQSVKTSQRANSFPNPEFVSRGANSAYMKEYLDPSSEQFEFYIDTEDAGKNTNSGLDSEDDCLSECSFVEGSEASALSNNYSSDHDYEDIVSVNYNIESMLPIPLPPPRLPLLLQKNSSAFNSSVQQNLHSEARQQLEEQCRNNMKKREECHDCYFCKNMKEKNWNNSLPRHIKVGSRADIGNLPNKTTPSSHAENCNHSCNSNPMDKCNKNGIQETAEVDGNCRSQIARRQKPCDKHNTSSMSNPTVNSEASTKGCKNSCQYCSDSCTSHKSSSPYQFHQDGRALLQNNDKILSKSTELCEKELRKNSTSFKIQGQIIQNIENTSSGQICGKEQLSRKQGSSPVWQRKMITEDPEESDGEERVHTGKHCSCCDEAKYHSKTTPDNTVVNNMNNLSQEKLIKCNNLSNQYDIGHVEAKHFGEYKLESGCVQHGRTPDLHISRSQNTSWRDCDNLRPGDTMGNKGLTNASTSSLSSYASSSGSDASSGVGGDVHRPLPNQCQSNHYRHHQVVRPQTSYLHPIEEQHHQHHHNQQNRHQHYPNHSKIDNQQSNNHNHQHNHHKNDNHQNHNHYHSQQKERPESCQLRHQQERSSCESCGCAAASRTSEAAKQSQPIGKQQLNAAAAAALERKRKRSYRIGLNIFNRSPEEGLWYLGKERFVDMKPRAVAQFLLSRKGLSKQMIGEYLGDLRQPFNMEVLECCALEIDLKGLTIDDALRKFQSYFRMPGEAQKIEHLMEVFAASYCEWNPEVVTQFRAPLDTVFLLSYAVVMLNTDLHNASVKPERKMKLAGFIRNLKGIDSQEDVNPEILSGIYERIRVKPFHSAPDHLSQVLKVEQMIGGHKKPDPEFNAPPGIGGTKKYRPPVGDFFLTLSRGFTADQPQYQPQYRPQDQPQLHASPQEPHSGSTTVSTAGSASENQILAVPHRRLVCFCRLNEVTDGQKKEQHHRDVFLFNDNLVVTKMCAKKKSSIIYNFRQIFQLKGMAIHLFENQYYRFGIQLSRAMDSQVYILLSANSQLDQLKFVHDLREAVMEMNEMEVVLKELKQRKSIIPQVAKPSGTPKALPNAAPSSINPPKSLSSLPDYSSASTITLSSISSSGSSSTNSEPPERLGVRQGGINTSDVSGLLLRELGDTPDQLDGGMEFGDVDFGGMESFIAKYGLQSFKNVQGEVGGGERMSTDFDLNDSRYYLNDQDIDSLLLQQCQRGACSGSIDSGLPSTSSGSMTSCQHLPQFLEESSDLPSISQTVHSDKHLAPSVELHSGVTGCTSVEEDGLTSNSELSVREPYAERGRNLSLTGTEIRTDISSLHKSNMTSCNVTETETKYSNSGKYGQFNDRNLSSFNINSKGDPESGILVPGNVKKSLSEGSNLEKLIQPSKDVQSNTKSPVHKAKSVPVSHSITDTTAVNSNKGHKFSLFGRKNKS